MKKIFFFSMLFMMTFFANAQYLSIGRVQISHPMGDSRMRQHILLSVRLNSDGMDLVYNQGKQIAYEVTATWEISAYLKRATKQNVFYPVNGSGGHGNKNGEFIEFEIIDDDAVKRLSSRGVSASDFIIRSYIK